VIFEPKTQWTRHRVHQCNTTARVLLFHFSFFLESGLLLMLCV